MKNRRPRLKRTPTLADRVAEMVRDVADELEVRVSVFVVLYKRGQDLVSADVPKAHLEAVRQGAERLLVREGLTEEVTLEPYQHHYPVWLSMSARVGR